MGHGTSSLLVPTSGSSTQAELVGIAAGAGFQDLKVRALILGTGAVTDTGLSRSAATTVAIGNGTQGDFSGTLLAAQGTFVSSVASNFRVYVGDSVNASGGGWVALHSTDAGAGFGDVVSMAQVNDPRSGTAGTTSNIAGISFNGLAQAGGGGATQWGCIRGGKENNNNLDYKGFIGIVTQSASGSGSWVERWRVSSSGHLTGRSDVSVAWTSGATSAAMDTGLSRTAAAVVAVGNGTSSDASGTLRAAALQSAAGANLTLGSNASSQMTFTSGGGVQVGAPTGGDKGSGTINATGLFVNGAAVSTSAGSTPTLAQVLGAGNTTPGGGTLLTISTGDSISYLATGTSSTNNIRWPNSSYVTSDSSNNLILAAGGNVKLITGSGTGAGSASLGANCPATTVTAPFTWLTIIGPAGDTLRVPAWK